MNNSLAARIFHKIFMFFWDKFETPPLTTSKFLEAPLRVSTLHFCKTNSNILRKSNTQAHVLFLHSTYDDLRNNLTPVKLTAQLFHYYQNVCASNSLLSRCCAVTLFLYYKNCATFSVQLVIP